MARKSRLESASSASGSTGHRGPVPRLRANGFRKPNTGCHCRRVSPAGREGQSVEDALSASKACFSLFMDHLPGIAFLKDPHGRYVYVSSGFVKLTGRAPGLCVGSSDEEYWPESAERLRAEDQYVIETGHALTAEETRTTGGETRHYETVKFPIPDKHGATVLVAGISIDITRRKVDAGNEEGPARTAGQRPGRRAAADFPGSARRPGPTAGGNGPGPGSDCRRGFLPPERVSALARAPDRANGRSGPPHRT